MASFLPGKKGDDVDVTGTYQAFCSGGQTIGGMFTKAAAPPSPFWLYYFNIDDVDTAVKRVKTGGGQILNGPVEVRDGSWVVQCTDPQGAVFALIGKRKRTPIGYFERTSSDPSDQRRRRWSW